MTSAAGFDIRVQRCFAFDETDTWWWLVDEQGCRDDKLISEFTYDRSSGSAEATIYSMFRLPHSNRTSFQCDVAICKDTCPKPDCSKDKLKLEDKGTYLIQKLYTQTFGFIIFCKINKRKINNITFTCIR